MIFFYSILVGLVVGFASGLLGIGGGALIVPALMYFFAFPIKKAIGTSLLIIIITAISGSLVHWRAKNIDFRLTLILGIMGMGGAQLGAYCTRILPDFAIQVIFGVMMLALAVQMILKKGGEEKAGGIYSYQRFNLPLAISIGLGGGFLSGLLGIGGAVVIVPLIYIFLRVPLHVAIGTSLTIVLLNAVSGGAAYALRGEVQYSSALIIGASSIAGSQWGARVCARTSQVRLKKLFAGVLIVVGIMMSFKK